MHTSPAQSSEGGALGVAILAAVGTGLYSSVPEACDAIIRTNEPLMPDAAQAKIYDGYFRLYDRLYQALKPEYADTKKLWAIHYSIYEVQHEQERQNAAARQKKQEIEH